MPTPTAAPITKSMITVSPTSKNSRPMKRKGQVLEACTFGLAETFFPFCCCFLSEPIPARTKAIGLSLKIKAVMKIRFECRINSILLSYLYLVCCGDFPSTWGFLSCITYQPMQWTIWFYMESSWDHTVVCRFRVCIAWLPLVLYAFQFHASDIIDPFQKRFLHNFVIVMQPIYPFPEHLFPTSKKYSLILS